jgi:hypothetical protein
MPAYVPIFRRYALWSLSMALFAVCLAKDGYYIAGPNPRAWAPAWGLLLAGWLGVFYGTFAWVANPALFFAWLTFYLRRYQLATTFALIATLFMLSFLLTKTVVSSEAPTYSKVIGYGAGYWLWVGSALALLVGSILQWLSAANMKASNLAP